MAARELRYEYFEQIRKQHQFKYIATAHHQDDLIETFFLNLSRKTGIKGLTGIKEKTEKLIRPLLFAGRVEIENYAAQNYIEFRDDSSNSEIIYRRNFLRHKILPLFEEWNPAFKNNVVASISNLRDTEKVYTLFIQLEKEKVLVENNQEFEIPIQELMQSTFPKILLFEILTEFNFNSTVINEVFQSFGNEPGKQFFSKSHRLIKDREVLYVSKIRDDNERIFYVENDDIELFKPLDINIEKLEIDEFQLIKSRQVACIDLEKLEFPLLIRKWKQGDYFQPLGMQGFKKVSDFFIDEKIPLHEKENTWLLCSGETIVWIMGRRIDNRFKVTPETKKVLKLEIK
jgi:tRNA(Ile)-lysidine synthase